MYKNIKEQLNNSYDPISIYNNIKSSSLKDLSFKGKDNKYQNDNSKINSNNTFIDFVNYSNKIKPPIPSTIEWANSIYSFNKNKTSLIPIKDVSTQEILTKYFSIFVKQNKRKSINPVELVKSTKRSFLSELEIKHTNDKNTFSAYLYDREKEFYLRKMSYFGKLWKVKFPTTTSMFRQTYTKSDNIHNNIQDKYVLHITKIYNYYEQKGKHMLMYFLYNRILNRFGLKIDILNQKDILTSDGKNLFEVRKLNKEHGFLSITERNSLKNNCLRENNTSLFLHLKKNFINFMNEDIFIKRKDNNMLLSLRELQNKLYLDQKFVNNGNILNLVNTVQYALINKYVHTYSESVNKTFLLNKINFIYRLYSYNYYNVLFKRSNKVVHQFLRNISRFNLNVNKLSSYLSLIKGMVTKIYEKKTEFNLINLKYFYLNSDVFTQLLSTKLEDRTRNTLRILEKSLTAITVPKLSKFLNKLDLRKKINNFSSYLFSQMSYSEDKNFSKKKIICMNDVQSKWIMGIIVEAKGRLTNRYSIGRSISYIRNKGGLKETNTSLAQFFSILLRNFHSSNIQYTKFHSKRRIGTFGLKVRISSN